MAFDERRDLIDAFADSGVSMALPVSKDLAADDGLVAAARRQLQADRPAFALDLGLPAVAGTFEGSSEALQQR